MTNNVVLSKHYVCLYFVFLFFSNHLFSQTEVFYYKDVNDSLTIKTIGNKQFTSVDEIILEAHSNASFWFKIPKSEAKELYVFKVKSHRVKNPLAFQKSKKIEPLPKERFLAYKFNRAEDVYVKVSSDFVSYFPFELQTEVESNYLERIILSLHGFYYGFVILVILYLLIYFFYFKDYTFLYYGLFLLSLTLSFLLLDGTLLLFGVPFKYVDVLILLNYICITFFSSKFTNSFLELENFYPKLKRYTYTLGVFIILLTFTFYFTRLHNIFLLLNILSFLLIFIYWFTALSLFTTKVYNKIFVFAFATLLFTGIDSFVFKNLGFTVFSTDGFNIKLGGIIQIVIFWFAIISREKILRRKNKEMKEEIIFFSKNILNSNISNDNEIITDYLKNLSVREREIFDLILKGKTNKQIALDVNISVNTVKFHVKNIYEKLGINSRKEAMNLNVN